MKSVGFQRNSIQLDRSFCQPFLVFESCTACHVVTRADIRRFGVLLVILHSRVVVFAALYARCLQLLAPCLQLSAITSRHLSDSLQPDPSTLLPASQRSAANVKRQLAALFHPNLQIAEKEGSLAPNQHPPPFIPYF